MLSVSENLDSLDRTFSIDQSLESRRWFTGVLNIMIYQVEGASSDILTQQYKLALKNFKSTSTVSIALHGKVKRL
jgi:hypothetical protein